MRATAVSVYAPTYGALRLVVTRNRHGNREYIVTNDSGADLTSVVERKMNRWSIETLFRDTKQYAGLEACQCRIDRAMVRHVGLVLLSFVVLQMMRRSPHERVGTVKERWQLEVMRDGQLPPPPLKACPSHCGPPRKSCYLVPSTDAPSTVCRLGLTRILSGAGPLGCPILLAGSSLLAHFVSNPFCALSHNRRRHLRTMCSTPSPAYASLVSLRAEVFHVYLRPAKKEANTCKPRQRRA